jgi:hypothetical protein
MSAMRRHGRDIDFGCDFCADEQNRLYGHVPQIASDDDGRVILLHCPLCGAYYEDALWGLDKTRRLSSAEAQKRYGID